MTREEAITHGKRVIDLGLNDETQAFCELVIEALEQESCDAVSRQVVKEQMIKYGFRSPDMTVTEFIEDLPSVNPQEPKTGHCKDCKWWKDSDGLYRRGGHAESQCPINRREVFEGNGYCYMFEPQERSDKE